MKLKKQKNQKQKRTKFSKFYFLSSSRFGALILKNLDKKILQRITLISFEDKPAGRGLKMRANPAKIEANNLNLPILEIKEKKDASKILTKNNYDLAIVAGISLILPEETLTCPKNKLKNICIHPSLLPLFRGPSPIQTAILQDEKETGVTIFELEKDIDTGKILFQKKIQIDSNDNAQILEEKLAQLSALMLNKNLDLYLKRKCKSKLQNGKSSKTYFFKKEEGKINSDSPKQIWQKFKAFYPWPGVYFELNEKKIKITDLEFKSGKILIKKVIPEGKKEIEFKQFLAGYSLPLDLKDKIIYSVK